MVILKRRFSIKFRSFGFSSTHFKVRREKILSDMKHIFLHMSTKFPLCFWLCQENGESKEGKGKQSQAMARMSSCAVCADEACQCQGPG